jgi:predicted HAD superfamily Cof-like phosphohydrolase
MSHTKKLLLLKDVIAAVEKFHNSFGIDNNYQPTLLSEHDSLLRYKLMREENEEYLEATQNDDLVEVADALGDMLYILAGTILKHGLQDKIEPVFEEIQRSNMSKLDKNGNPIVNDGIIDPTRPVGKVLKSDEYTPPNLKEILEG